MKSKTIDKYRERIQNDINEISASEVNVVAERYGMLRIKADFIFGKDLVNIILYLTSKKYRFCLDHGEIVLV